MVLVKLHSDNKSSFNHGLELVKKHRLFGRRSMNMLVAGCCLIYVPKSKNKQTMINQLINQWMLIPAMIDHDWETIGSVVSKQSANLMGFS